MRMVLVDSARHEQRRAKFRSELDAMLQRSGFGSVVRPDGSILERHYDVNKLVDFAMIHRLDNESPETIYELYTVNKFNSVTQQNNSPPTVTHSLCALL